MMKLSEYYNLNNQQGLYPKFRNNLTNLINREITPTATSSTNLKKGLESFYHEIKSKFI